MPLKTTPLPALPTPKAPLAPDVAAAGPVVPALIRLKHMSATDWEDVVLEWQHSLKNKYARVEKRGGAGDMGLDVIGFVSATDDDPWDNYQCKHYDHALAPGDIWLELGKLVYYSHAGEYSWPRAYFLVAPRGPGNTLSKLLRKPNDLKKGLLEAWPDYCETKITSTGVVKQTKALKAHIGKADFSIFSAVPPLTLIDEHAATRWHVARFGGGLPDREPERAPPAAPQPIEAVYIRALLDAYEDRLGLSLGAPADVSDANLSAHFSRSRREFYSAEALREFSRDNVPPGTFEHLLKEVHDGVVDIEQSQHVDGYARVLAVVQTAKSLPITSNALIIRTRNADRGGMCHQLANDSRLRWRQ